MTALHGPFQGSPAASFSDALETSRSTAGTVRRAGPVLSVLVTILAASAALLALVRIEYANAGEIATAVVLAGLITLAWLYPLPLTDGTDVRLDLSLLLAAVLLLDPALALLLTAGGTAAAQFLRGKESAEALFITARAVLPVGAAVFVLAVAGWDSAQLGLEGQSAAVTIGFTAGTMIVVSELTAVVMAVTRAETLPGRTLLTSLPHIGRNDAAILLAQVCIGAAAAFLVNVAFWTLGLFLHPAFAMYLSLAEERRRIARERESLLIALSHDLRSPLTVIQGQSQLLCRKLENDPDPGGLKRGLERIDETSRAMSDQITAMLDHARAEWSDETTAAPTHHSGSHWNPSEDHDQWVSQHPTDQV
jgi:signal transduction histidine kinase